MPSLITAGDASNGLVVASGNDGAVTIQSGPAGAKVNAISIAADGTPTLITALPIASGGTGAVTSQAAIDALGGSIGVGQTWQSVSRTSGTNYTNSTGRTIACQYAFSGGASLNGYFVIAGFAMPFNGTGTSTNGLQFVATAEIPNGAVYSFNTNGSFVSAQELR